jgi:cation diffusion facilitator CzcD-associated flavoprotein CzcO
LEIRPHGIVTADGKFHEVDAIAVATGFDSVTGGITSMGIKDVNGVDLADKWHKATYTYLGLTTNGFPNMFFTYGAQAPTAFSIGPACAEFLGHWIIRAIQMTLTPIRRPGDNSLSLTYMRGRKFGHNLKFRSCSRWVESKQ